jgi:hypothetical protein
MPPPGPVVVVVVQVCGLSADASTLIGVIPPEPPQADTARAIVNANANATALRDDPGTSTPRT